MPDPFGVRLQAARDLVDAGLLDGELALSYVLFPSEAIDAAATMVAATGGRRHGYSDEQKRRALDLVDAGWSWAQAGREVGVAKTTVGTWIRKRGGTTSRRRDVSG